MTDGHAARSPLPRRLASRRLRGGGLPAPAQHVAKPARLRHPDPVMPDDLRGTVLETGQLAQCLMGTSAQAGREHLPTARRDAVDACARYLTGHLDQLHYDTAPANGRPIATGAVEGACRHLIADRLDITGARWGLHGAEALLRLRAVVSNGGLDPYWRYHGAREHARLCPTPDERTCTLTA